jgi:hypothetical protein
VWRLALPSIISNVTVPLMGAVEMAVIGHAHTSGKDGASVTLAGFLFAHHHYNARHDGCKLFNIYIYHPSPLFPPSGSSGCKSVQFDILGFWIFEVSYVLLLKLLMITPQ